MHINLNSLRNLSYDEAQALGTLEQTFPSGRQDQEAPVPGKPGHYYPSGTLEYLKRKLHSRFARR